MQKSDFVVVSGFASTDRSRSGINGIRIESGRLIATDGHQLIVVHEGGERKPPTMGDTATVALDSVKALTSRALSGEAIEIDPQTGAATIQGMTIPCNLIDAPYPDYTRVLPPIDREGCRVVRLDAHYLKRFCDAIIKTTEGRIKWIELRIEEEYSPVRIDGDRVEGALMPQRR